MLQISVYIVSTKYLSAGKQYKVLQTVPEEIRIPK